LDTQNKERTRAREKQRNTKAREGWGRKKKGGREDRKHKTKTEKDEQGERRR
jgi:hypothetical protein